MGQIEMELSHINKVRKNIETSFDKKEMSAQDYYATDLKYLVESSKRLNSAIQLLTSAAKHSRAIRSESQKMNILGDNTAINTFDSEIETVQCVDTGKFITRQECFDYSKVHNNCDSCPVKKSTLDSLTGNNR
jgi:hypothetical protein